MSGLESPGWVGSAVFSQDALRAWRYRLSREWDTNKPTVNFVGLNPSTADENVNDPTVRRCLGYAQQWGFGKMIMTNIFAWRATDPAKMRASADPVGPENDSNLRAAGKEAQLVVACWGEGGRHLARWQAMRVLLPEQVRCFGVTKSGQPKHPLYLASHLATETLVWPGDQARD